MRDFGSFDQLRRVRPSHQPRDSKQPSTRLVPRHYFEHSAFPIVIVSLKKEDINTHNQAIREREAKLHPEQWIQHRLHPQHQLQLVSSTTTMDFQCKACLRQGTGDRYRCSECDLDLHTACALSDDIFKGLTEKKIISNHETSSVHVDVHQHPLELVSGSEYTCGHCHNKSCAKDRYHCLACNESFDVMCANHPARLSSFLHPEHELELKTRHHFKKCAVCRHRKDSNARVYSCEVCEFYVHPECAVKEQYIQRLLHANHTLVFGSVSKDETFLCASCRKKCEHWCYLCPACKSVYFHPECIDAAGTSSGKSMKKLLGEELKEELENIITIFGLP